MIKADMSDKTYSYFRSTLNHLWQLHKEYTLVKIREEINLDTLDDLKKRYLAGFEDYLVSVCGLRPVELIKDKEKLSISSIRFTEGAEDLIWVLGKSKMIDLLDKAIPEFKKYGLVVTEVLRAK